MTFASDHFSHVKAHKEAARSASSAPRRMAGTEAERMFAQLALHRAALKAIKSRAAKIAQKREFLPQYAAYVDGVLEADGGAQDDVVTTVMLWRLDVGDFDGALEIADYALRHDLAMPDYISRDAATTLVEEIADAALADPRAAFVDPLETALLLTEDRDMVDEVRAKAEKALGLALKDSDPDKAIAEMEAALALDPKCGVKTELNRLKKAQPASETGS